MSRRSDRSSVVWMGFVITLVSSLLSGFMSSRESAAQDAFVPFTRSDCNADGNILSGSKCDLADTIFLLNHLFRGGPTPTCRQACDSNADDDLDIADGVFSLVFCFSSGAQPPAPFEACGVARTENLDCRRFEPCESDNPCAPQLARAVGACALPLGVWWNGRRCVSISGCECEGPECDELYDSIDACQRDHADCPGPCVPQEAEGVGACRQVLGWKFLGPICVSVSGCECAGDGCLTLYDSFEACQREHEHCDPCEPDDARGTGPCDAIVGIAWDGRRCVELSGCECEGSDCGAYDSIEECERAHADCRASCEPMDAQGEGPCAAIVGVKWDGDRCVSMSGCSCVGTDCDKLYAGPGECEAANARCLEEIEPR